MATAITKAPTAKVRYMTAPARGTGGSRYMTVKWDLASTATDSNRADRIGGFEVLWDVICISSTDGKKKILHRQYKDGNTGLRSASINLNEFVSKEEGQKVRDDFYPGKEQDNKPSVWKVTTVRCFVRTYNAKGSGPWVYTSTDFRTPRAPTVSQLTQTEDSGVVSCTVAVDAGNDLYEVYNGKWEIDVEDSSNQTASGRYHGSGYVARGATGTVSWDVSDRMRLTYDEYVKITVKAWARGFFGDSAVITRESYVSWPARPVVTGIDFARVGGTGIDPDGKTTIRVDTSYSRSAGKNIQHPVTGVKLQVLRGTTYKNVEDIPATEAENWEDLGAVDDGFCTALSAATSELRPDADEVTWIRIKAWNTFENIFYLYSTPRRLEELEWSAPTAAQDSVIITSLVSGDDGKSAVVQLGWNDDNSNHTEVSWSESPNAWRSTSEPSDYGFDWDDGPITVGSTTYQHSATVHIAGLTEGNTYHVRARRYRETDDLTTYGSYYPLNGTLTVTPATSPDAVVLSVPTFVARGAALPVSWTYSSEAMQTMWQLVTGDVIQETDEQGKPVSWMSEPMRIVQDGTDAAGSYVIPAERVESITQGDSVKLAVIMSTGGLPVASEAVEVRVADAPTVEVSASTVTAQPVSFDVHCSVAASLAVVVTAQGSAGEDEILLRPQASGDAVWSAVVMPEWSESNGAQVATIEVGQLVDLRDGAAYEVSVIATDIETGLQSERATATFEVEWARQAPEPPDGRIVKTSDVTDEGGYRTRSATIELPSSTEFEDGDVIDLYRVTVDGPSLLETDLTPATTVIDRYAAFGGSGLAYRVAVRTVDGDVAWRDYQYLFGDQDPMGTTLRVDFGNDYVEVSRNVTINDTYDKDVKTRKHLDGTTSAYWNAGVSRTSSGTGAVIRVYEDSLDAALRRLARYVGPVMVRTSMGHAYEADVEVSSLGTSRRSAGESVSLSITAVSSNQYGVEVVEQ